MKFTRWNMLDTWIIEHYGYPFQTFWIPESFVVINGRCCPLTARTITCSLN